MMMSPIQEEARFSSRVYCTVLCVSVLEGESTPVVCPRELQDEDRPSVGISKLPRRVMGSNETITTHYVPE